MPKPNSQPAINWRWLIGTIAGAFGAFSSGVLVLGHLTNLTIPGCRDGGGCAQAAASPWSVFPVWGFPVAGFAFAFFLGATVYLVSMKRAFHPSPVWRAGAGLGAMAAFFYLGVSILEQLWCPYCVGAHGAALALCASIELGTRRQTPATPPSSHRVARGGLGALISVATLAALAAWHVGTVQDARVNLRDSVAAMTAPPTKGTPARSLEGRFPLGSEHAKVHVVVFTGYQCHECQRLDVQLEGIAHPDVAISIRHFPFCTDCNRAASRTVHPNGCRAAAAAEIAGRLRGRAGFWAMHRWLMARRGAFTPDELRSQLVGTGYDAPAFESLMHEAQTLALVRDDVEEALRLGVKETPTVYINNVELRGLSVPGALGAGVAGALASSAPSRVAPPTALEKIIADWRSATPLEMSQDSIAHAIGPADARINVLVFGDYQDNSTAELDSLARALAQRRADVRYTYRHFPADKKCNPSLAKSLHPLACRLARTVEAAGVVAGDEAFWKAHTWILAHHQTYTDADFRDLCSQEGWDARGIFEARDASRATDAVANDVEAGAMIRVTELPCLIVQGRRVSAWKTGTGEVVLEHLLRELDVPR